MISDFRKRADEGRIKGRGQRKGVEFTLNSVFRCECFLTTGKLARESFAFFWGTNTLYRASRWSLG